MLKAQMILIRAALDEFEQALQAGDLRRARKKAAEAESIGHALKMEMDIALSMPDVSRTPPTLRTGTIS